MITKYNDRYLIDTSIVGALGTMHNHVFNRGRTTIPRLRYVTWIIGEMVLD
jgi:hypothetical protein